MDLHCHIDLYPNPQQIIKEIEYRKTVVFSVTTTPTAFKKTKNLAKNVSHIYTGVASFGNSNEKSSNALLTPQNILEERFCRFTAGVLQLKF